MPNKYQKRIAAGLCAYCGTQPPEPKSKRCAICSAKRKERDKIKTAIHRQKRREAGLCVACGKTKVANGAYCKRCRKRSRAYTRKWKVEHPDRKQKAGRRHRDWHWKIRLEVINAYGGKCVCCGEIQPLLLTIDHRNGDGKEHRKKLGQKSIYPVVKREGFPKDRYQLLCFNCNIGRHHNGGTCPHKEQNYP